MPIYNGQKYLKKCIDSILAQKYTDFEVILVDDGSSDGSLDICREYEQKDSRVVVFHKENAGLVAARKSGVELAKGEYIGFVDCDDFIDDDMYLQLMTEAEKKGSDIVAGGMTVDYVDRSVEIYHKFHDGFYDKEAIENVILPKAVVDLGVVNFYFMPAVWLKIFRREVLEKSINNVFDSIRNGEDVAITLYSLSVAQSLSILKTSAYHYVQSEGSMTRGFNANRLKDICAVFECISKIDNDKIQKQIATYISHLVYYAVAEAVLKSGYSYKQLKIYLLSILKHEMVVNCLKAVDTSNLSIKEKMKIFFMRHKMVCALKVFIKG